MISHTKERKSFFLILRWNYKLHKMEIKNKKQISIIIISCDKYKDIWGLINITFKKFWPDCPYVIYFMANSNKPNFESFNVINVGDDVSWSDNLHKALSSVDQDYVFLWIDDLFLTQKVDSERVAKLFNFAMERESNYLCLNGMPRPDKKINKEIGEVSPGSLYRVSTVLSLWKKETLIRLLKPGESAWQFELDGSVRSDQYSDFFVTRQPEIKVSNGVIKGKWRRSVFKKFQSLGLVTESKREIHTRFEELIFYLKRLRTYIFNFIPNKFQRKIRGIFIK